jgi:beta-galactosidase/beta-glucuronidase
MNRRLNMKEDNMRNEYPRPQLVRENWQCLNGQWELEFDPGNSGLDRGILEAESFESRIEVPFCPESELSGIGEKDFMNCLWYARGFILPPSMAGKRVFLHFEAVDFEAQVWCNGVFAGGHRGGYSPFAVELTDCLSEGENRIVVRCFDDVRSGKQAVGKQSGGYFSGGCHYTRTTGIWQTVWLEAVPHVFVTDIKYDVDIRWPAVTGTLELSGYAEGLPITVETFFEGRDTGAVSTVINGRRANFTVPLTETHLWECGNGRLYDVKITAGEDELESYFGLREVAVDGNKILINGKPVYQRLVLDQGFYPDGIYTAPSDEALVKDITLSMAAGFNGARMHQKVFEQRFMYHADKMGYLLWGEYPSWGLNIVTPGLGLSIMLPEWLEILKRDRNHPSIVGWCPLNETFQGQDEALLYGLYQVTRAVDPTRPVIDASGYMHVVTDIWDVHDYDQRPEVFAKRYAQGNLLAGSRETSVGMLKYDGRQPFFVSEYGGIWWSEADPDGWGYGERIKNEEEFYTRLEGLTDPLLNNPEITAFCYTQLTDVEQEQNGIYYYDRGKKFDIERIKRIFGKEAAMEKG